MSPGGIAVDPHLIRDPDWTSVVVFVSILAFIVIAAFVFNRSPDGDWVDEHHGSGSVDDEWER